MKVLKVEPGMEPEVIDLENTCEAIQEAVDGYFEVIQTSDFNVVVICNEEGKLNHLPVNRIIKGNCFYDVIVGTIIVVGMDGEEFCDLSDEEAAFYADVFTPLICEV